MPDIYWAGDSTVQYNSILFYPQAGIGQAMHLYLKPGVNVYNHARNGRSTKSFIDEGRLKAIDNRIKSGDFLFIQFGHNDEKSADPSRYTTPHGTFKENLKLFIKTARNHGAYPVIITPIERRCFQEDGKLGPGAHGDYVAGAKETAAEENCSLIDLYSMSRDILNELGPKGAEKLHLVAAPGEYQGWPEGKNDGTHLCYEGAVKYCGCIAAGLRELGGVYEDILLSSDSADEVAEEFINCID